MIFGPDKFCLPSWNIEKSAQAKASFNLSHMVFFLIIIFKLYIHQVVENLNRELEALGNMDAYVGNIDANRKIKISEYIEHILQTFIIKANRKWVKRLEKVAAYNVA